MRAIGRAYLTKFPHENHRPTLIRLLREATQASPDISLRQLEAAVRTEYEQDDLVSLDGWIFSRSEARLYALAVV